MITALLVAHQAKTTHEAHPESVAEELELTDLPAMFPAGPSGIEIRLGGIIVGDVDVRVCDECQLAVIEHVRIEPAYRRRGLASRAIKGVLAQHSGYRWSTSPIDETPDAQGFWNSLNWPGLLGTPLQCEHMARAEERTP